MARVLGRVADETGWAILDPLSFKLPSALWLSKDYGKLGARYVLNTMPAANLAPAVEPTAGLDSPAPLFASGPGGQDNEYLGSNHNVIVDAEGNWISMLHTGQGGAPGGPH